MIDQATFERLRERYRATGEINDELYALLGRLAAAVIFGSRLAPAYSPSGAWDRDSTQDALHGWITRRLLQTNALLAAFDFAERAGPFLSSLEQNFRHYLENERERGELGNLTSRSGALLREDEAFKDFVVRQRPTETWWGLAEWQEPDPFQGSEEQLLSQAWALGEVRIFRYSQRVERASPILSTETLREFLLGLFERVDAMLTVAHLAEVFRRRFDLGSRREVELSEEVAEQTPGAREPDEEQVRAAAAALLAELSPRQVEAIMLSYGGATLEQIAAALDVSRGTADNALRSAGPVIDKHCVDGVTRRRILEKVLDALS